MANNEMAVKNEFEGSSAAIITRDDGGIAAAIAREEGELKTAIVLARQFRRDESEAAAAILKSCSRIGFAETALYSFPRGNATIQGPTVDLAREMARLWGNIRYGCRVVSEDDERIHLRGYAFDLQTNGFIEAEDKFKKLIQRKVDDGRGGKRTEWVKPDERDLRELVNRRAAFLVRNSILSLMPSDLIDAATAQSLSTMRKSASGELQQDREQAIRRMVLAYNQIGVTAEMLRSRLGHELDAISPDELAELRTIYKSLIDGNSRRDEHFAVSAPASSEPPAKSRTEQVARDLKQREEAKTAEPKPAEKAVEKTETKPAPVYPPPAAASPPAVQVEAPAADAPKPRRTARKKDETPSLLDEPKAEQKPPEKAPDGPAAASPAALASVAGTTPDELAEVRTKMRAILPKFSEMQVFQREALRTALGGKWVDPKTDLMTVTAEELAPAYDVLARVLESLPKPRPAWDEVRGIIKTEQEKF